MSIWMYDTTACSYTQYTPLMFWHSVIDASVSVITCSFITIPRVFRDIMKYVASINSDAERVKTTPHDQSLATPDSRGCDVESQTTTSTNTTCQSQISWESSDCDVKNQDSLTINISGERQLSWNARGCDAGSENTINTNVTGKNQFSWDLVLAEAENPLAGFNICLDC
jgi:hypothetical protein